MAGDGVAEIDLYDNIDEDFVQECSESAELYDDVINPVKSDSPSLSSNLTSSKQSGQGSTNHTGRRVACYVGNLTWWTSDQDLLDAAAQVGIHDVLETKFHENRQNGQSKGFCVVVFGSDQSLRTAIDKLTKVQIHGQNPVVTHCTKHNLTMFEKATGGDSLPRRSDDTGSLTTRSTPMMSTPTMPASLGFSLRNTGSLMGQAAPSIRQLPNAFPNALLGAQPFQSGIAGQLGVNLPVVSSVLLPPSVPPPPLPGASSSLFSSGFTLSNALPTSVSGAHAHVNPNFLQNHIQLHTGTLSSPVPTPLMGLGVSGTQSSTRPQFDNLGRPVIHTYTPSSSGKLSESEFEDILQRNKTVSSSAINRAVQDAASGNYASAIETLVTAISLIKQSKIATDDRCRILIDSLQDTLHGIEAKSYGSKSSSRRRRRSYSDSGSENGLDTYNSGGSSSRRRRDRSSRSRSRDRRDHHDRHDRHRRSRDRISTNNTSYYGSQSILPSPGGGATVGTVGSSSTTGASGGSDRYRDSRYRH